MQHKTTDFVNTAADFLRDAVSPSVRRELATLQVSKGAEGRDPLIAGLTAWLDDIDAGRDEAALAPTSFAVALEMLWLLSVVGVLHVEKDGRSVDLLLRPELTRALQLAAAAASALDMLRGSAVEASWRQRQVTLVDTMAEAATNPAAGCAGTA